MRPVKNLIRLRECAGWSESLLGAHARGYGFWRCESFQQAEYKYWQITVYLFFLYFLEYRAGHVIKSFPSFGRNWILSEENWEYISLLIILLISPRVGCMLINKEIMLVGPRQAKNCLPACTKCAHAHHPAHTQGLIQVFALYWYIICSIVSNDSGSGLWRPWSDCADAQADLGLRCPHLPEDTFSHGATKLLISC